MTCDFQQCGILTSVASDEPVQPPLSLETLNIVRSVANTHIKFRRLAKALIRLRVYAGWCEPLLEAHTTLLEISCRSSIILIDYQHNNNIQNNKSYQWIRVILLPKQ